MQEEDFDFVPNEVYDEITEDKSLSEEEKKDLLSTINEFDEKQMAVFEYFDYDRELVDEIKEHDFNSKDTFSYGEYDLLVLTDSEADDRFYDYLEQTVDECCPEWLARYVDLERLARDSDRGQELAGYDGTEYCANNGIYIYRT